ncbi:MAG: hypothetical protein FD180_4710 [Planctomycetota bacterium]|nr:MAG: hypothetical protein FD180_4710 [Planctomycetota bacterium]
MRDREGGESLRSRAMKRPLASLLTALCLTSCGGDDGKNPDPKPGNGNSASENPADVDLEAECRAAADKWKTLQAKYSAEGATNVVVTLAFDRSGRAALHVEPGIALVLDGATLHFRAPDAEGNFLVAAVPIGHVFAAAIAIADGKPLPARGENPPVPAGHVGANLALGLDDRGRSQRHAQLAVSLRESSPFGWLSLLHPQEGYTVRAVDRTAVVSGPCGRVAIDRDTGSLVDWQLEPPGGRLARLRRESFAIDEPLDPALFKLAGKPMEPHEVRGLVLDYTMQLSQEVLGKEKEWKLRLDRTIAFVTAYYRAAWTDAEIGRLAELGAKRRREIAKEYRANHPDWAQADIDAAVSNSGLPTIAEAVREEMSYNVQVFVHLARPASQEMEDEFTARFTRVVTEELAERALAAGKDR